MTKDIIIYIYIYVILNDIDTVYMIYHHLVSYLVEISTYIILFNIFKRTEGQLCRLAQRWYRGKCLPWHGGTGCLLCIFLRIGSIIGEPQWKTESDLPRLGSFTWRQLHISGGASWASWHFLFYTEIRKIMPWNHGTSQESLIERAIPCEFTVNPTSRAWCFRTLPSVRTTIFPHRLSVRIVRDL